MALLPLDSDAFLLTFDVVSKVSDDSRQFGALGFLLLIDHETARPKFLVRAAAKVGAR
jgi:hypothetical protein